MVSNSNPGPGRDVSCMAPFARRIMYEPDYMYLLVHEVWRFAGACITHFSYGDLELTWAQERIRLLYRKSVTNVSYLQDSHVNNR